jgi:hypothetical protein
VLVFETGIAECELMCTADKAYVVGDRVVHRDKARLNGRTHTDSRATGYGNDGLVRYIAIHVHTDVTSGEVVIVEALDCDSVRRDAERVNRSR